MKPKQPPPSPWEEQGALEATEALRTGDEEALAAYIKDLASALNSLEAALRPTVDGLANLVFSKTKKESEQKSQLLHEDAEWDGTLGELEEALRLGSSEVVASYLHDAHLVLRRLSKALAPPVGSKSKKLTFKNASRGRHSDHIQTLKRDTNIRTRMKLTKGKKKEAIVAELMKEYGLTRSQIFKIAKTS